MQNQLSQRFDTIGTCRRAAGRLLVCGLLAATVASLPDLRASGGDAMALPEGRLGEVLKRHYEEGLGGLAVYDSIESLRLEGSLMVDDTVYPFRAFKKKPDLFSISFNVGGRHRWKMAYDGKVAWQRRPDMHGGAPHRLEDEQRERFVLDSHFSSYLLYATAPGKRVTYIDTIPVDGRLCHQIDVHLPNGFHLSYFIDVRSSLEHKVVIRDSSGGRETETYFDQFVSVQGMPIARRLVNRENGRVISTVKVDRIEPNLGMMPWMFAMPED